LPPAAAGSAVLRSGRTPKGERHVDRDRLLRDLRWLAEGNPRYAGTDEEGRQNRSMAQLMADDLLLSYIGDGEITKLFNEIRGRYSPIGPRPPG
jgi:hypothetical protein